MQNEKRKKTVYKIPFVNNGKPFTLPDWSVVKHKKVLKKMSKYDSDEEKQKYSAEELDDIYQTILILEGLQDIDSSVTEQDLDTMHPADKTALFAAIYYQGRSGIIYNKDADKSFHQKKK